MNRLLQPVFTAACALAFLGAMQGNPTALAQGPDKPAAQPAPPAARAAPRAAPTARPAPPAARAAPRAAPAAPRQVARPPAPRPAARAPARAPATVQRAQPQRPAAVQRTPQQLRQRQALPQQSAPRQMQKGPRRPDVATTPSARPVSRVQATDQQRREVRQRLFADRGARRISRSQLNVALAIGSRIPRRHHLLRFAPALLALVPAYAAYRYLIVDDSICVVDPETYGIVDVIPSSIEQAGPPSGRPALALSADQMRCVYAATPKDQARSDLHIRLALGAEIPRNVELFAFPEEGLACAPELAAYRYIVVEDDVVIVDPADYAIAAVISG
jgi:hypothetical protein